MKSLYKKMHESLLLVLAIITLGCKSFVTIDPPKDQIVSEKVYLDDETAISAVRGIYAKMMSGTAFASGSSNSVTLLAGRSADDFTNSNTTANYIQFSQNNLSADNTQLRSGLWQDPYQDIHYANSVLENLEKSDKLSAALKVQLSGEAKFIRAFCLFYLTNLFGPVPIVLTTDYRINAIAYGNSREQIYLQLIKDLTEAKNQLSENYPSTERIRVNKWAATALLARVYLYHHDWVNAETQSSEVISKTNTYKILGDLNQVFLKNSQEAILQFVVPAALGRNTQEGNLFILTAAPGATTHVTLSADLVNAFESKDLRLSKWIGTFSNASTSWKYAFKYKVKTGVSPLNEYSMVLRLAEQYLIRSEARAMLNNFSGSMEDLNVIRRRAGLDDVNFNTQAEILTAIEKERRLELFSEWGHRWLDLKRTNRADAVLSVKKGLNWQSSDLLYPIPASELLNDSNLIQN